MQLDLFSWIMLETFNHKPALEHFLEKSSVNVDLLYTYWLKQKFSANDLNKISFPPTNPQPYDKLLYIVSCQNAKWELDFFIKVDSMLDEDEIATNAKTSLPSINFAGT